MALVECAICGWSQEVDEGLTITEIELKSLQLYAEHQLRDHPQVAHADPAVHEYISIVAAIVAPTNGVLKRRDLD